MPVPVHSFLKRRRDRAVGQLLGYLERVIFPRLSVEERAELRRAVLAAIDGYHDAVLDLTKSDDGGVRNEEVLNLLDRLDRLVRTRVDYRPARADESSVDPARAEV